MKKSLIYVAGLLVTAAFHACSSEDDITMEMTTLKVTADRSVVSRTELQDDSKTVYWSGNDMIYLFDNDGSSYASMNLTEGAGQITATFEGHVIGSLSKIDKALYPVPTVSGGEYTFDFPAARTWSANSAAPMIGDFANNHVNFRNLAALVRIHLDGCTYDNNSTIVLTMNGQAISGTATVDIAAESIEIEGSGNTVTITKFGNAEFVDIPVPAGKYTGYTVTLNGTEIAANTSEKTLEKDDVVILGKVSDNNEITTDAEGAYLIKSLADLLWFAEEVNNGNNFSSKTVKLAADINLANKPWTPIGNSKTIFQGTFDGQEHTISNLFIDGEGKSDQGFFGFTTNGEIKNLTVNNAKVTGRLNVGVVAGTPNTSKYTNIKVTGHVEVNGMAYVGGVGGKNAYANWTDVTVEVDAESYVKANSVEGGTAYRTYVGGVVGFNGEGGHSFTNIKSNINVSGTTCDVGGLFGIAHYGNKFVNCSSSGHVEITNAAKASDAEEMGGLAGVWHNQTGYTVTFTDCSFTGTLKANITEGLDLSNNLITGAAYSATETGRLFIDGFQIVNTTEQLATVVNNATEDVKVALGGNMKGDVIFKQKADVDVIVDGRNFKYEGTIYLHGAARSQGAETLTIQNVNFVAEAACDFISANSTASAERYAHNVTVKNCTFKGVASADVVGMRYRQCYNMKVVNCTATDMHSLMWATGGNGIEIDGVTVENSQNGVSFGTSNGCVVKNSNFASYADYGYGIRVDASGAYTLQVSNCTLTADVPILLRKATGAYSLTLDGQNTLTATGNYQMILTSSDYESGVELTPATGAITMSGTTGLTIYQ